MNITLLTAGTRGDVQPFVALALELRSRGHTVTLAAPTDQQELVRAHGVTFAPLRADYLQLAQSREGQAAVRRDPRAMLRLLREVVLPGVRELLRGGARAATGADTLVFHPKALAGRHLTEALGVPGWVVATAPLLVPTTAFPAPATTRDLGPLNRLTYALVGLAEAPLRSEIDAWRRELGLGPARRGVRAAGHRTLPVLHAHSRHLVTTPPDWDPGAHVTGFWTLAQHQLPPLPDQLRAFLQAGPAPVTLGFGSLGTEDPEQLAQQATRALRALGRRGVLLGLPGVDGEDVLSVPAAPHGRLFERSAASVHHGGAGTTAASLLARIPSVVVPHGLDQPFWAERVTRAGAGVTLPRARLDARRLQAALQGALAPQVQRAAATLGSLMRSEGGVTRAADLIERGA